MVQKKNKQKTITPQVSVRRRQPRVHVCKNKLEQEQ